MLEDADLVAIVLQHADLGPAAFVSVARVGKAWHVACRANESLLLAAARRPEYLTKRTLMGLFALHWHEADKLPRGSRPRRNGGFLHTYTNAAIDRALPIVGGLDGWRLRIAQRAEKEQRTSAARAEGRAETGGSG